MLSPVIVEALNTVQSENARDFNTILKKDAIYNAVGIAAFNLYDEVDFDNWLTSVLLPELKIKEPGYHIIRRRVIWLMGEWVAVKLSPERRPLLYEAVLELLKNEEDIVVRLEAAHTLKVAVDDFEFCTEQFLPFLENSIAALFNLLKEVKQCDLKLSVLHVLSFVIERMGSDVRPYVDGLMQYLPHLWGNCGEYNMMRCGIISCFVHLVEGLGTLSENLHPMLLPMIAHSTDVTQPPHVYLIDDGLDLWWAVMDNTSTCTEELLLLADNILPILEFNEDNMKMCLRIVEAYIVLAPEAYLKKHGQRLVDAFVSIVRDLKREGVNLILKVIETSFIVFPEDAPLLFKPMLSYVLSEMFEDDVLPISMSLYLALISRVILHNQTCFASILREKANELHKDVTVLFGELLDVWLEKMPLMNPVQRRKLLGLALTCLLTYNSEVVFYRACGISLSVVEVLNDIVKCDSEDESSDLLVISPERCQDEDEDIETEHYRRVQELSRLDPVYTVILKDYLYNQVMALEQSVGATKFQEIMSSVDVETMQQLQQYLKI